MNFIPVTPDGWAITMCMATLWVLTGGIWWYGHRVRSRVNRMFSEDKTRVKVFKEDVFEHHAFLWLLEVGITAISIVFTILFLAWGQRGLWA